VISLPAMSLGDRFCMSRKGGKGGGWRVYPNGVNIMAVSELSYRKALVGLGWVISLLLCTIGVRKQSSHLVGPALLLLKAFRILDGQLLADSADY